MKFLTAALLLLLFVSANVDAAGKSKGINTHPLSSSIL
jgi:hypothetical protein